MPRASKRAKVAATTNTEAQPISSTSRPSTHVDGQHKIIPFDVGPSLERIPDDILREVLSHLPTLTKVHVLHGPHRDPPAVLSDELVRTPTLRALSKTSRLLRSRCLPLAWKRIEVCGVTENHHNTTFFRPIGENTKKATSVLNKCSHLWPLIQTVSVILTRYQHADIIPAFAQCLTSLPNLTNIEVIHAHSQMTTMIKAGFEGKRFPSVRKITLPSCAHEILKCCPNVEEVICTEDNGSTIVGSIVKGNCNQVRVLKGIWAPIKRLVKFLPNLNYITAQDISVGLVSPFADFPLLDTIEIRADGYTRNIPFAELAHYEGYRRDIPLVELAQDAVQAATKILKENKSQADKFVKVTRWIADDQKEWHLITESIKV